MAFTSFSLATPSVRPFLLLEVNEIPWRLVDHMLPHCPQLRRFFSSAETYTTFATDTGELSPWITWPSLHRGMPNTEHGIQCLGQDVHSYRGTPLWEEYRKAGLSIGICGSLQSWPPMDPGPGGFFVPDPFAQDARCIPSFVEPLQRFGLQQVATNRQVVQRGAIFSPRVLEVLPVLWRIGVRPRVYRQIVTQLLGEMLDSTRLARRPTFQTLLAWEMFRSLYDAQNPPAFATFFTNHLANLMHRFWHELFPEDFAGMEAPPTKQSATLRFAFSVLEQLLEEAFFLQQRVPGLLLGFASSMGQGAVYRPSASCVAAVVDRSAFAAAFVVPEGSCIPLLAMVPQVAFRVEDEEVRHRWVMALQKATTTSGAPLFTVREIGSTISITMCTPSQEDIQAGGFLRQEQGEPIHVAWKSAGIRVYATAQGTGYHIPEGVLGIVGNGVTPDSCRQTIPLPEVKSLLLRRTGFLP